MHRFDMTEDPTLHPPQISFPLTNVPVYGEGNGGLPLSIVEGLGRGQFHRTVINTPDFDLKTLAQHLSKWIIRADWAWNSKGKHICKRLILQTRRGLFAIVDKDSVTTYAPRWKASAILSRRLYRMACAHKEPRKPSYCLIERSYGSIDTQNVPIDGVKTTSEESLSLLYGESTDFPGWYGDFLERFRGKPSGLTILEGPPGTGKTSFLRHLVSTHSNTHCFYYLAPHEIGCLVDSEFIAFWARQRELHQGKHLSLILEDAEQALMARANDNRSLVQVILNYSDGMLADFLRLQIIATVNCTANDLDEALLRPGRLMARRHFGRLSRSDARRLASHHGLTLPPGQDDYSLAEIFNEQGNPDHKGSKILGFAA